MCQTNVSYREKAYGRFAVLHLPQPREYAASRRPPHLLRAGGRRAGRSSVKKNSGYGKKAFFTTTDGNRAKYLNTKNLKAGSTYYYKVRGVRTIDGQKSYTQWSNKVWRTVK